MFKKLTATVILVGALTIGNGAFAEENTESPELEEAVGEIVEARAELEAEVDADTEAEVTVEVTTDNTDADTTEEDATVEEGTENTDTETTEEDATVEEGTDNTEAETPEEDVVEEEEGTDADGSETEIITPESSLYEAIRLMEEAVYILTEETVEKALLLEEYANKRLAETEVLLENGNVEAAEQLLEELFEEVGLNLEEATKVVEDAKVAEEADPAEEVDEDLADVEEEINENISKRSLNLLALLERDNLPEQAKAGVRKALANQARAMERSNKNKEVVVEDEDATEEETEDATEEEVTEDATVEASAEVTVEATEEGVTTVETQNKKVEKANAKVEKAIEKANQRVEKAVEKGQKGIEKALEKAGNGRP